MAFWNFCHSVVHVHVYLLPSLIMCICMIVTGLGHKKKQEDRQDEFNKELSGEMPGAPEIRAKGVSA